MVGWSNSPELMTVPLRNTLIRQFFVALWSVYWYTKGRINGQSYLLPLKLRIKRLKRNIKKLNYSVLPEKEYLVLESLEPLV